MTRRGQGTVELALGLTLLVPVVMIGWSFAEAGVMAMKVTEASESALWAATKDPRGAALGLMAADATRRYADFDGRTSTNGLLDQRRGVSTVARGLRVECGQVGMGLTQPALLDPVHALPIGSYCSASARLELFGGLTRKVCAQGRPDGWGGPCATGRPMLAMNDGALQNHSSCTVTIDGTACENGEYFNKVNALYRANGGAQGNQALQLVQASLGGLLPLHARTALGTYLSFQGEDAVAGPFREQVRYVADDERDYWHTTPYGWPSEYLASHGARESCYLGAYCDSPSIEKP